MIHKQIGYLDKIIHELNGQIHNIGFITDIMLDSQITLTTEETQENIQYIQTAAEKLKQLIGSLASSTDETESN